MANPCTELQISNCFCEIVTSYGDRDCLLIYSVGSGPAPSLKPRAEVLALTGPKTAGRIFQMPEKSMKRYILSISLF